MTTRRERDTGDAQLSALRILVVDDNQDAADSLAMLLIELGHSVRRAYDGRTALLLAAQHRPQLIFLDLIMPRMDGLELAHALRELPGLDAVSIFAVTGHSDDELRDLTRAAGFHGYLVKPATLDVIRPVLGFMGQPGTSA